MAFQMFVACGDIHVEDDDTFYVPKFDTVTLEHLNEIGNRNETRKTEYEDNDDDDYYIFSRNDAEDDDDDAEEVRRRIEQEKQKAKQLRIKAAQKAAAGAASAAAAAAASAADASTPSGSGAVTTADSLLETFNTTGLIEADIANEDLQRMLQTTAGFITQFGAAVAAGAIAQIKAKIDELKTARGIKDAAERTANEAAGRGKITDEEVKTQKTANKDAGRGEITDEEVRKEKTKNQAAGLGDITDAEVATQKTKNQDAGRGNITDEEVKTEKAENLAAGFGNITHAEAQSERAANQDAGRGNITDEEVRTEKAENLAAGRGDITDEEAQSERVANQAAGHGAVTNAERDAQIEEEARDARKAGNPNKLCYEEYLDELRQRVLTVFDKNVQKVTGGGIVVKGDDGTTLTVSGAIVDKMSDLLGAMNYPKDTYDKMFLSDFVLNQEFLKFEFSEIEVLMNPSTKKTFKSKGGTIVGLNTNLIEEIKPFSAPDATKFVVLLMGRALEVLGEGGPSTITPVDVPECLRKRIAVMENLMKDFANPGSGSDGKKELGAWVDNVNAHIVFEITVDYDAAVADKDVSWTGDLGFLLEKVEAKILKKEDLAANQKLKKNIESYIAALKAVQQATAEIDDDTSSNVARVYKALTDGAVKEHPVAIAMAKWMETNELTKARLPSGGGTSPSSGSGAPALLAPASKSTTASPGGATTPSTSQTSTGLGGSAGPSAPGPGGPPPGATAAAASLGSATITLVGASKPSSTAGSGGPAPTATAAAASGPPASTLSQDARLDRIEQSITEMERKIRVESHFLTGLAQARVKAMDDFGGQPAPNVTAAAEAYVGAVVNPLFGPASSTSSTSL